MRTRRRADRRPCAEDVPLVIALPKGRVLEEAVALFGRAGFDLSPVLGRSRRLVHDCGAIRALVVRAQDVPTYVDHGAADAGVAGRDVLDELGGDRYEPIDLGIGRCRMVLAEPADRPVADRAQMHLRVATKYPVITRRHLEARGVIAEVIELSGSVELGPLTGLAHRIVDLVETGATLRDNGLREVETIMPVTSRLIVNPARLKLRPEVISRLVSRLERALERRPASGRRARRPTVVG
jgi:ATP phosphoribosyltransferase